MNKSKELYEAWRKVAGRSLVGEVLPDWKRLPALHRHAWMAIGVDLGAEPSRQLHTIVQEAADSSLDRPNPQDCRRTVALVVELERSTVFEPEDSHGSIDEIEAMPILPVDPEAKEEARTAKTRKPRKKSSRE
jgi:hypothetical protein